MCRCHSLPLYTYLQYNQGRRNRAGEWSPANLDKPPKSVQKLLPECIMAKSRNFQNFLGEYAPRPPSRWAVGICCHSTQSKICVALLMLYSFHSWRSVTARVVTARVVTAWHVQDNTSYNKYYSFKLVIVSCVYIRWRKTLAGRNTSGKDMWSNRCKYCQN